MTARIRNKVEAATQERVIFLTISLLGFEEMVLKMTNEEPRIMRHIRKLGGAIKAWLKRLTHSS